MATYISRTLGTPTNNKKWTFSAWFKMTDQSASDRGIMSIGGNTSEYTRLNFDGSHQLEFDNKISGSSWDGRRYATAKRTDPSSWYHVVAVFDSDNGTAADRMITYFNGTRITAYNNSIDPSSGAVSGNTSGETIRIGVVESSAYFNGLMSHVHFCDGQAYAPSDFGQTDSTSGVWTLKTSPSVTYGNNGFFLKMEDSTNLDLDSSSNGHTFTTTGTLTATKDNPSNNFPIQNPNARSASSSRPTLSNGSTTGVFTSTAGWRTIPATMGVDKGLWYYEAIGGNSSGHLHTGIASTEWLNGGNPNSYNSSAEMGTGTSKPCYNMYNLNGNIYYSNTSGHSNTTSYGNTCVDTDYIGVFFDLDANKIYWSKNGTIQNSGTGFDIQDGFMYLPAVSYYNTASAGVKINFGNGVFGSTALTGTENTDWFADNGGEGKFKYNPSGTASGFDGSTKHFRCLNTKNIKLYG